MIGWDKEEGLLALIPNAITDTNYISSSVAEPDPNKETPDGVVGEVEWVAASTIVQNARRIRSSTHRIYRDNAGGVSNTPPENDPVRWTDEGPTNKWAWADSLATTRTVGSSPMSFKVRPGAGSDIEFFGLRGVDTIHIVVYAEPGGSVVYDNLIGTDEYSGNDPHWALYFLAPLQGRSVAVGSVPLTPGCEVDIVLSSADGSIVEVGLIAFGVYEYLGFPEYGFETIRRDYGYTIVDKWGNLTRVPGAKGKDLKGSAILDTEDANGVDAILERLLDVGAVYTVTRKQSYRFMKTWGLVKPARMSPAGPNHVLVSFEIEGNI